LALVPLGRTEIRLTARSHPARVMVLGGEPLGETVKMWWNFVARSENEITEAWRDWQTGNEDRVGPVPSHLPRIDAPPPPWLRSSGRRASALGLGGLVPSDARGVAPGPFQRIELACGGLEDVDDDVSVVDENPFRLAGPLDTEGLDLESLGELLLDVLGQRLDVWAGGAGGDDENVSQEELTGHIEQQDVGPLLGEDGVCRHPGHFDTVLYDDSSVSGWIPTISPLVPSV